MDPTDLHTVLFTTTDRSALRTFRPRPTAARCVDVELWRGIRPVLVELKEPRPAGLADLVPRPRLP